MLNMCVCYACRRKGGQHTSRDECVLAGWLGSPLLLARKRILALLAESVFNCVYRGPNTCWHGLLVSKQAAGDRCYLDEAEGLEEGACTKQTADTPTVKD
ncbi:unnamed protein product [Leuciscus chuanchicus]